MGYRSGSECFETAAQAAAVQCSAWGGVTSAGLLRCSGLGGSPEAPSLAMELVDSVGAVSTFTMAPVLAECDPFEPYADLSAMWGFALPAVLGVVLIREFVLRLVWPQ